MPGIMFLRSADLYADIFFDWGFDMKQVFCVSDRMAPS